MNNRRISFEIMRIIAAFFVIFNHTIGFWAFHHYTLGSFKYWAAMILSVFCKFSVPLFFMISGALLIEKYDGDFRKLFRRIIKMMCILSLTTLFYYLVYIHANGVSFSFGEYFKDLYAYNALNYSLWYLYAYLGFLIMLPLLHALVKNINMKCFYYWIGLVVVFLSVIPALEELVFSSAFTINEDFSISPLIKSSCFYPCLGYVLSIKINLKNLTWKKLTVGWGLNCLCILISCFLNYKVFQRTFSTDTASLTLFHSTFVYVNAIMIFVTLIKCEEKLRLLSKCILKGISCVGSCTFGIYLIHIFILRSSGLTDFMYANVFIPLHIYDSVVCSLILSVVCFLIGFIITFVGKSFLLFVKTIRQSSYI